MVQNPFLLDLSYVTISSRLAYPSVRLYANIYSYLLQILRLLGKLYNVVIKVIVNLVDCAVNVEHP